MFLGVHSASMATALQPIVGVETHVVFVGRIELKLLGILILIFEHVIRIFDGYRFQQGPRTVTLALPAAIDIPFSCVGGIFRVIDLGIGHLPG